ELIPSALIAGQTVGCLVILTLLRPRNIRVVFQYRSWFARNPWRGAGHIGLSSLMLALQQLDLVLLRGLGGGQAAGMYAAVARWTQPVTLLANSVSQANLRHFANASTETAARRRLVRSIRLCVP